MKTNITLTMILLVLLSACASNPPAGPTIDVSLAYETTIAGVNGTGTANAPTATLPPTATLRPNATDTLTPTPVPTYTPLPELPPDAIDLQWITAYGLPGDQDALIIHPTKDGGFILLGYGVLLRLRADGLIVWQKSLGSEAARDVMETSTGDFILAGDIHWIKLDSQGDLLWQHEFVQPPYHTGNIIRLVEESNGNIVVEAAGSRTVFNADGEQQSITEYVPWDSQLDLGNIINRLLENPLSYLVFVHTTADGGAFVGINVTEDVGDVASMLSRVLITRYSKDGSVRWQRGYGGHYAASYEDFHTVETESGDIIVAGTVSYYANNAERNDIWMFRLARNGNSQWEKVYATEGQDAVAVIQELSNGDLIFAGRTSGAGTGGQDMWVLKTNAQGEIPNCGLMFGGSAGTFGSFPDVETKTLEDELRLSAADAQAIPLCAARPSP